MKLIRSYRFRREAFKMLTVSFVVLIGGFGIAAAFDWIAGKDATFALRALWSASLILLLLGVLLLLIWLGYSRCGKAPGTSKLKSGVPSLPPAPRGAFWGAVVL